MARKMMIPTGNGEEKKIVNGITEEQENIDIPGTSAISVIAEDRPSPSPDFKNDPELTAWKEKIDNGLEALKQISQKEEIAKEALANDYVDPSHLGDIREKIYSLFQRSKEREAEFDWTTMKKKKSSSGSAFWYIQSMLELYVQCMQLCDIYLKSAAANSEDSKNITNIYAQIESKVNYIAKWFSSLDSKGRLEQIGKKDEISMEQMDNMITKINDIKYLPVEYKQSFINPLIETKKELADEFYIIVGKSAGRLLGEAIISSVFLFVLFCAIGYFLWSWIGWIIVAGYWWGVYSKFKHLKGYDNYFNTNAGTLKLFFASLVMG